MARPKKNAMVPAAILRAKPGNGGPACGVVGNMRTTANTPAAASNTSTLPTTATIPAAVMDAVGFLLAFTTPVYHLVLTNKSAPCPQVSLDVRFLFA
jgi:hypothetical protein